MVSELNLLIFLNRNQPAFFNQIIRESKIRDEHALQKTINRLIETEQIRLVPNPKGPQNRKYYALKNYQSTLSPIELENLKKIPRKPFYKVPKIIESPFKKSKQMLILAEIYLPIYLEDEFADPILKKEIRRLQLRGKHRHGVSIKNLKQMIILSELYYNKRHVCKKFGITVKAFEENIKRYPELQEFRAKVQKNNLKV